MIQEIKVLMPPDYLYQKKSVNKKFEEKPENQTTILRHELLENYLEKSDAIESIIFMSLKKDRISSKMPKYVKNNQNSNAKL